MVKPNGKAHVLIGCSTWYFIHPHFDITMLLCIIGSLLPDADHRHAPAGRLLPLWIFFKHRGITHTVWALLIATSLFLLVSGFYYSLAFFTGYFMHLIADSMTPSGVDFWGNKKTRPK